MLKMSLLYADTVTLYSIALPIYLGLADAGNNLSYEEKLEHLVRLRPLVGHQDMADWEQVTFSEYKKYINWKHEAEDRLAKLRSLNLEPPAELREFLQQLIELTESVETKYINGAWVDIGTSLDDISHHIKSELGLDDFDRAVHLGLLQVDEMGLKKLDAWELLLRSLNNLDDTDILEVAARRFADVLTQLLFMPDKSYPLLDTKIGETLRIQPEFREVTVSRVQAQKAKHAGFASSLFEQLPTFTEITLDEILDIRKELSSSLIVFRGAVAEYAELLESDVWDEDFDAEADKVYEEKVRPAVEAIRLRVEEQGALRGLARVSMNTIPALAMGAMTTGEEFLTSSFQQLVALGFTGFNAVVEAKEQKRKWDNLKNEKVFFYYKMTERYGR